MFQKTTLNWIFQQGSSKLLKRGARLHTQSCVIILFCIFMLTLAQCTPYVMLITRVNVCVFSLIWLLMCLLLWWTVGKNRSCAVSINRTSNGSLKHILQQFDGLILWQSFWQRIPHSSLFTQPPSSYHSYHRSHSTQLSLSLFLSLVSCHTNLLCMLNSKLTASFMLWTLNPDISFPF